MHGANPQGEGSGVPSQYLSHFMSALYNGRTVFTPPLRMVDLDDIFIKGTLSILKMTLSGWLFFLLFTPGPIPQNYLNKKTTLAEQFLLKGNTIRIPGTDGTCGIVFLLVKAFLLSTTDQDTCHRCSVFQVVKQFGISRFSVVLKANHWTLNVLRSISEDVEDRTEKP